MTAAVPTSPMLSRPVVGTGRAVSLPTFAERNLDNGLRVVAVRRAGVPMVELRLRVPMAGRGSAHAARATVLTETLLSGTERRTGPELAAALQALGGGLSASVDADRFAVAGSALAPQLPTLLDLLAEVLTTATFPAREVAGARDRLGQEITIARSSPAVLAGEALLQRLYGTHPYGRDLPDPAAVAAVTPGALRTMHRRRLAPDGALLVLVGDLSPARSLETVERALAKWSAGEAAEAAPPVPAIPARPMLLVDRPGAVQTNLRIAGPAPSRSEPGYAALQVANLVFGGYFSSRLVDNIRERRGYTYSPHSGIEHPVAGSRLVVSADVATAVTAPALLETLYELGRIATGPVTADELDAARRYAVGTLALSTATQSGLAGTLAALLPAGLGVAHLRDHPKALGAVTVDDVLAAARAHLAPAGLTTVLLGDADRVRDSLGALGPVEVVGLDGAAVG